jgi:glycosyltransferase involved in cell wall biosynthesis
MRKKILIIIPQLGKGGAEKIIFDLVNNLYQKFDISLLLFHNIIEANFLIKNLKISNVNYIFPTLTSSNSIRYRFNRILSLIILPIHSSIIFFKLKIFQFDLIHYNLIITGLYSYFFSFFNLFYRKKIMHIETFHTNWHLLHFIHRTFFFLSWLNKNLIIVEIGKNELAVIKKLLPLKNVVFIPFSIDIKGNEFEKNSYKNKNIIRIVTISRFVPEKRIDIFIEAIVLLRKENLPVVYEIYGDGPLKKNFNDLIDRFNAKGFIKLLGYTEQPLYVLANADFYLITMVEDFTGISGLQAAYFEIPIIGFQTVSNFRFQGESLMSFRDSISIKNAILSLLKNSEIEKNYRIVIKNYKKYFSFKNFIKEYSNIYRNEFL